MMQHDVAPTTDRPSAPDGLASSSASSPGGDGGLAVVIQGGAMRCLYSVGAIRAIVDAGLHADVRSVHGVSSGAIPAAMLHLACTGRNVADFIDNLTGQPGRLVKPWRIGRMIDLDRVAAILDEMLGSSRDALNNPQVVFEVALTDARTGRAHYVDLARLAGQARRDALRATMAFPALYSKRIEIDGAPYLDGGIADPLPLRRALDLRPHRVIAITNKEPGRCGEPSMGPAAWAVRLAPGIHRKVKAMMLNRNPLGVEADQMLERGAHGDVDLVCIAPSGRERLIPRTESNRDRLVAFERRGYRDANRILGRLEPRTGDPVGTAG